MKITNRKITSLDENEVFIFSSNHSGFHGAGSAGMACRGDSRNTWRGDAWFLKAMQSSEKSPDRIGKWAVYGVAHGFQQGKEGKSYAIQTVTRPGVKRSTPLDDIESQLVSLWDFIKDHKDWNFIIPPIGEGYAGYTAEEMKEVFNKAIAKHGDLENIEFVRTL